MSSRKPLLKSLRGRLTLSLVAVLVISLAVWLFIFHILVRNELLGSFDDGLVARMQALAAYTAGHPGAEDIAEYMPEFRTQAHEEFFQVWDASGRILARSDSSAGRDMPRLAAMAGRPTFHDLQLPDGHDGRAVVQTFRLEEGDPRGSITVASAGETAGLMELEQRLHGIVLLGTLATIALSVAIAWTSVARSLRPVERFAQSVSDIDPDSPLVRLDSEALPTELVPVAGKVRMMAQKLVDALARERRFARNVAHELRTPLTEARTLAEVGMLSASLEQAHRSFLEIDATTQELDQIVDSLLCLARFEAGIEQPSPEPVELATEFRRQATLLQDAVRERGLEIRYGGLTECWVYVDGALTRRLIANLLGNAVAHSPDGATIDFEVNADGFVIGNPAPQLGAEDLPRLGERFLRIGSTEGGRHAGLGLSLAQAVAGVLQVEFTLQLTATGKLLATVSGFSGLPATPPAGTAETHTAP